ncbi:O-antigen ligase family protein [Mycobacterium sp. SMC-4]|uniref:O-antigen ligase family protein n=1 Tax=Mycobacterium sp. SMC-4 TaxID=2857059 RepID=UPI003D04F12C
MPDLLILVAVGALWFPTVDFRIGPASLNLCELALMAAAPSLLSSTVLRQNFAPKAALVVGGFTVMTVLSGLQILYVTDATGTLGVLIKFALSAIFVLLLLSSRQREAITRQAIRVFCWAGFASLLVSNLDYFFDVLGGVTYAQVGDRRSMGFFEHANQYAIWIISLVPLVLLVSRNIVFASLALLNIGLALVVTGSKFNLALVFVIAWFALGLRARLRLSILIPAAIPVFAFAYASVMNTVINIMRLVNPEYAEKVQVAIEDPLNAYSVVDRLALWQSAVDHAAESPVIGIGGGQAYTVLTYPHAHNIVLQYLLTYGVLGAVVILLLFCVAFAASVEGKPADTDSYRAKHALTLSLTSLFISNQFSDSMASQQILLFGIIVGILLALNRTRCSGDRERTSSVSTAKTRRSYRTFDTNASAGSSQLMRRRYALQNR